MKHVVKAFSLSPERAQQLMRWAFGLIALPLGIFILLAVNWPKPNPPLVRIEAADRWIEPLGNLEFNQAQLGRVVRTPADFFKANWQAVKLPDKIPLGDVVPMQADGPKSRLWLRLHIPPALLSAEANADGQLAIMGNRVMGGPWAIWIGDKIIQDNLVDWRIQWNVPLRVALPAFNAGEDAPVVYLAVPYPDDKGYAVGSIFMGPASAVDMAWKERSFWQQDISSITTAVAVAVVLITFQLALGRPRERLFSLLCANAFFWILSGFQYTHDFVGYESLSLWFGWAVDATVNWIVVLSTLVAFELAEIHLPKVGLALTIYACSTTLFTMPLWDWGINGLMVQHEVNIFIVLVTSGVLINKAYQQPTHERVLICLSTILILILGLHDIFYLTNQSEPDQIFTFQSGAVLDFLVFMYLTNRRYLQSLKATERYQEELQVRLDAQERQLAEQHEQLRELEVRKSLAAQYEAITLDLHDSVGSQITSGIHLVRNKALSQQEIILLLTDIGDEVRSLSHMNSSSGLSLGDVLAKVRQRVQPRLDHGAVQLQWMVSASLPDTPLDGAVASHLNAMLNEAIANVIKHARAKQICLHAEMKDSQVTIQITDDGMGFDMRTVNQGRGLLGMQHRAELMPASLVILTEPGKGCTWRLTLQSA